MVDTSDKKLIDALRESEERYREIFNSTSDAMFIHDSATGMVIDVNNTMLRMYGFTDRLEVFNSKFSDLNAVEEGYPQEKAVELLQNAIASEKDTFEWRAKKKNGELFWVEVSLRSTKITGKERVLATVRDISERKKAEEELKTSEARNKALLNAIPDLMFMFSREGVFLDYNSPDSALLITPPEMFIGRHINDVLPKELAKLTMTNLRELFEHGKTMRYEYNTIVGSEIRFFESRMVLCGKDAAMSIVRDITDHKKTEIALRESKELLFELTDQVPGVVYQFYARPNGEMGFYYVSNKSEQILGLKPDLEGYFERFAALVIPEHREGFMKSIEKSVKESKEWKYEGMMQKPTGEVIWFSGNSNPLPRGKEMVFNGIVFDITDRKQAAKVLQDIIDRNPISIQIVDKEGFTLRVNSAHTRLFGAVPAPNFSIFADLQSKSPEFEKLILLAKSGEVVKFPDLYYNVKDLSSELPDVPVWIRVILFPLNDSSGKPERFVFMHEDITERKKAEDAFRESEEKYRQFIQETHEGINLMDEEGRVIIWNKMLANITGIKETEAIGAYIWDVMFKMIPPEKKSPERHIQIKTSVIDSLKTGVPAFKGPMEIKSFRADGEVIFIEQTLFVIKTAKGYQFGAINRDITESKRLIEHALQSQKLESLGVLAGGIAHDFNNLLGGIFGYIDLAAVTEKKSETSKYLSQAISAIDRARNLTRQLLTFAKGGVPAVKPDSLTPFIQETAQFALSGSSVSCRFDIPDNIWLCSFDRNQIAQVIDNIVINAQQAMPLGGVITMSARNIESGSEEQFLLGMGKFVAISIKDTGIGIPKEILPRIFDPFFTTKQKGHGLGLASCYSIITQHGGIITVESEPGRGSTFTVYLPAAKDSLTPVSGSEVSLHKGGGRVLIMDDEESMREIMSRMLEKLGYDVVCVRDGAEAISVIKAEQAKNRLFTAAIFDLTIPGGMGGEEAALELRKMDINIPIFVASGYAESKVMADPEKHGFTASISKPFVTKEFISLLNRHLSGRA